jgi:hypothetical protein
MSDRLILFRSTGFMMSQRKSEQREQKDAKKTEKRAEIGMVEVEALTNTAYGFPLKYADNKTKAILTEKYVKAGVIDDISHIDFFIPRCLSPINSKMMPCIYGTAVLSAIKEMAGLVGKPLKQDFAVLGIYFDENDVNLLVRKITLSKGEQRAQTLSVTEIITSGAHGVLLYEGQIPPELMVPRITIGRMKSRGFGRIIIKWQ